MTPQTENTVTFVKQRLTRKWNPLIAFTKTSKLAIVSLYLSKNIFYSYIKFVYSTHYGPIYRSKMSAKDWDTRRFKSPGENELTKNLDNDFWLKEKRHRGARKTLNVYTVNLQKNNNTNAYSSMPLRLDKKNKKYNALRDGIVIQHALLNGSGQKSSPATLAHEVGHWLGVSIPSVFICLN